MFRIFSFARKYRPDWDNGRFIKSVAAQSKAFQAFNTDYRDLTPIERIAGFFRARSFPRFFGDLDQLRAAALRVRRERPEWLEQTVRSVREDQDRGLRIYSRWGPPLAKRFPWTGLLPGPRGDKLYRKRPHRFAFAPRFALAALYGQPSSAPLADIIADWMSVAGTRDNDICYDSNLEVVQRLLALSWAWAFLAAREASSVEYLGQEALVLKVIRSDIEFLMPRLGSSFANNHLLADAFAGWFIGCVWPELSAGDKTRRRFERLWLRELSQQILADGTSFEHSTHYHEYACEMAAAYVVLSGRNGHIVPQWAMDRTRRMLEFQAVLAGPEGLKLAIGDAAEDPLFPLDGGDGWGTAAWREVHRALFDARLCPSLKDVSAVERAYWLLGGTTIDRAGESELVPALVSYPNGGFFVFSDAARSSRLVFRTGPTEGQSISTGHVHSDLLSVYWSQGCRLLTVDAGTFTYRARRAKEATNTPDWRGYLRGPSAHNGPSIGGIDALGDVNRNFRHGPLRTFVSVDEAQGGIGVSWVDARVVGDGIYARCRRGVVLIEGEYFLIYDILPEDRKEVRTELGFQFAPEFDIDRVGASVLSVRDASYSAFVVGSTGLDGVELLRGSLDPLGGWVSPRYGELLPAPQARFAASPELTTAAFVLGYGTPPKNAQIVVRQLDRSGLRITISLEDVEDTLIVNFASPCIEISDEELSFRGALVWIRCRENAPSMLRWLNGTNFAWRGRAIAVSRAEPAANLMIESRDGQLSFSHCDPDTLFVEWPFES